MKRQRLVSAGSLSRRFESAAEAWRRQDYQQAIEILEQAGQLDPANANIPLDLGRAYGMRYDFAAAERCFEKAIRVSPQKTETLIAAGVRSQDFGHYEMARRYLDRAVQQNGNSTEALVRLAGILERQHRTTEATALVERALKADAACAPAMLAKARSLRLANQLDDAEKCLQPLINGSRADPWTRVRAWYELGAILDSQARYDEAMSAFLEAKSILRPAAGQQSAALHLIHRRVKELEKDMSADVLRRWRDFGEELKPPHHVALLCGHPRSGTTLLEQVLDSHPGIISAEETHVFHDEAYLGLTRGFSQDATILSVLESVTATGLCQSREQYFRFMEMFLGEPVGGRLLIDKNPSLTVLLPMIIRILPEIKFLTALRDPRDVCLSCFMQPLPLSPVSSAYLTLEDTAVEYASLMGLWRTISARMQNPFLEIRYEDLVNDQESTSRRALEFLGLPWDVNVLRFNEHVQKKLVRSPTFADVAKPVFKTAVGRWRNYRKYLEPCLEKLAPFVKSFGYE